MSSLIAVWCEYDIGGVFGGNNNQDVFEVDGSKNVEVLVQDFLEKATGLPAEELEGLFDWEYISLKKL